MSNPVTLEDIFQIFERSQAETERRAAESKAESDRRAAEADRRAAEADRRAAEADRRQAEWERIFAESKAEADRRAAEAERRQAEWEHNFAESKAESDRRHAELEKLVAVANAAVNNLTSRWGRFVENLVEPAAVRLFQERGIDVKETHKRMKVKRGELEMEIDIFVVDDSEAVAIEVKSHLTQEAVDEFLADLAQFKQAFPVYRNFQIYGAVAGIEIDENIDRYAYKKGLFVIRQSGDTVEIANDNKFKPTAW
jgi:hypothetical protein